jgi:hypothetical protein
VRLEGAAEAVSVADLLQKNKMGVNPPLPGKGDGLFPVKAGLPRHLDNHFGRSIT